MVAAAQKEDRKASELIASLTSTDGVERQGARHELVLMGKPVIPLLLQYVDDKKDRMRWEIAKTFEEMKDPSAAPAMVRLLTDDVPGVRWLAGEGLIAIGADALIPLLQGIQAHSHSSYFREGAIHVLHSMERAGVAVEALRSVREALEGIAPEESAPFAAKTVLDSLHSRRHHHARKPA